MRVASGMESALLERAGDLKRELLDFAGCRRFSKAFRDAATRFRGAGVTDGSQMVELLDWFVLEYRLPDGRTVVEHFAAERTDLPEVERNMLMAWRDVVEGVFEIRRREGPALVAFNLVDELTYRIRSNMGPSIFANMMKAGFMAARLVPVADAWMLSGRQRLYGKSDRRAILQVAAELSMKCPQLVFRNPEKLAQGWELQRDDRNRFLEWWGADLVVLDGAEFADRYDAYWRWRVRQTASGELSEGSRPDAPRFECPESLAAAGTVGMIYDQVEGLMLLPEFGLVEEAFDDPRLLADRDHRRAVAGYLKDASISAVPFRRLARRDPANASALFQRLLKKPDFSWEQDGEDLLRRRKAPHFAKKPLPRVIPASRATLESHGLPAR